MTDAIFNWMLNLPEFWRQVVMLSCLVVPIVIGMVLRFKNIFGVEE